MNHPLLDTFDCISIINLPQRQDRRRAVRSELQRFGIKIDGQQVRLIAAVRPTEAGQFPSIGARGCFMSHLKTLHQARCEGVQRLLVLEDDVMFSDALRHPDVKPLLARLQTPDWQLAYLGHVPPQATESAEHPSSIHWEHTSQPLMCTHCYAVHASAFDALIDYLQSCLSRPSGHPEGGPMHVDGALSLWRELNPHITTLITSTPLAVQRSSRSDIMGPSWIDRYPGANTLRYLRNGWRRWVRGV